jgi:zinc protease
LNEVGGSGELIATADYTSFGATVPADALDRALVFLAERAVARATSAKDLASEREALKLDRDRSERPPVARAIARLWSAAWPGHPYANTGSTITPSAAITPADIDGWRRSRLAAGAATLTVSGAFDADSALASIRRHFGGIARPNSPPVIAVATPRAALRARDRMDLPVRLCLVGWRAPGAGDPDAAALELLAAWLGGQPQARLGRVLINDWKLAVATQAGFVAQREGSLLWTMAAVSPDADSGAVETTLMDAVTGVTRQAPDAMEFERARRQVETSARFALQTSRQRAQALGEAEMLSGDATAAEQRLEALRRVTPADVQRVAARIMVDASRATLWVSSSTGGAR